MGTWVGRGEVWVLALQLPNRPCLLHTPTRATGPGIRSMPSRLMVRLNWGCLNHVEDTLCSSGRLELSMLGGVTPRDAATHRKILSQGNWGEINGKKHRWVCPAPPGFPSRAALL